MDTSLPCRERTLKLSFGFAPLEKRAITPFGSGTPQILYPALSVAILVNRPLAATKKELLMLYAMLCYGSEAVTSGWTKQQDAEIMAGIRTAESSFTAGTKLGPTFRLFPTTTATTLRAGPETLVLDGPFAETKEQLLGIWVIDCATLDDAIEAGRKLVGARGPGSGSLEIRPIMAFDARDSGQ